MTDFKDENPAYTMHQIKKLEKRVLRNKIMIGLYFVGAVVLAAANIVVSGQDAGMKVGPAVELALWTVLIVVSLFSAGWAFKMLILDDNKRDLERLVERVRWSPAPLLGVVRPEDDKEQLNMFLKSFWWKNTRDE